MAIGAPPDCAGDSRRTIVRGPAGLERVEPVIPTEARMEEAWPGLKGHEWERPFEFDAMRHHVFIGIPFESAETVATVVAEAAWSTGVAVFDPKRHLVGLPSPMADAPLPVDGIARLMVAADFEEADAGG